MYVLSSHQYRHTHTHRKTQTVSVYVACSHLVALRLAKPRVVQCSQCSRSPPHIQPPPEPSPVDSKLQRITRPMHRGYVNASRHKIVVFAFTKVYVCSQHTHLLTHWRTNTGRKNIGYVQTNPCYSVVAVWEKCWKDAHKHTQTPTDRQKCAKMTAPLAGL